MTFIIVGHSLDVPQTHWKHRLSTIQGLNLAFFIDTQNHRFIRGIQVKPNDITDLLDKEWIRRQFEMPLAMGLKAKRLPNPMNTRWGEVCLAGHRADAPVRGAFGFALEGLTQNCSDLLVRDRARPSCAKLIVQTLQPLFQKALAPLTDRLGTQVKICCNELVGNTVGGHQHEPSTLDQTMRQGP